MKRPTSKKSVKLPGLDAQKLITASLLVVAWDFVVETYIPTAWFESAPSFWTIFTSFSPFVVAALLAYVFAFGASKSQYFKVALSLIVAAAMFIFGLLLGPVVLLLPPSIGSSLIWGNLFIAAYFGASFALVVVVASKVRLSR